MTKAQMSFPIPQGWRALAGVYALTPDEWYGLAQGAIFGPFRTAEAAEASLVRSTKP